MRCELEAASGGKDDGSFSRLLVRGEDRSCKEPGINVLVLTETLDAGDELAKGFATHESLHAANRLADYLNSLPYGRTVRIPCMPHLYFSLAVFRFRPAKIEHGCKESCDSTCHFVEVPATLLGSASHISTLVTPYSPAVYRDRNNLRVRVTHADHCVDTRY